jgi:virginiamycin A acetyltransferase
MNSHVFGEIPAYSIYSGNPAKLIKYRFSTDLIEVLLDLKWWTYPHERILKAASKLCQEPTEKSIEEIREILEK